MTEFRTDLVKIGSKATTWVPRITAMQEAAMLRGLSGKTFTPDQYRELGEYVQTGDLSCLAPETKKILDTAIEHAKGGLTPSQAKRIWPRKIASVAIQA